MNMVRTIILFTGLSILMPCWADGAQQKYLIDLLLISSSSSEGIKLGIRERYNAQDHSQETLDIVATKLWQTHNRIEFQADTVAWLAKYIGNSGQARYRPLLVAIQDNTVHKPARRHVEAALNNIAITDADPFDYQNIDNTSLRTKLAQAQLKQKSIDIKRQAFGSITMDTNLDELIDLMGFPDAAASDHALVSLPRFGSIKTQQLLLKYKNVGLMRLRKNGDQWQFFRSMPYLDIDGNFSAEPLSYANMSDFQLMDELWTWDIYALKRFIRASRSLHLNEAKLDLIAQRIWLGREEIEPFTVDALAHLCKLIARQRNPRYALIMSSVATQASEHKLRSHAGKASRASAGSFRASGSQELRPL